MAGNMSDSNAAEKLRAEAAQYHDRAVQLEIPAVKETK
jgi:hypothetical protein